MPIIDYETRAKEEEHKFFTNPKISKKNKTAIAEYFKQYNVRPATKLKFLKQIPFILLKLPDFRKQMHNRTKINETFQELRNELSTGYISTIINVSKALSRWLNDGELPKGFKDVKSISKKEQQRNLKPSDMWTWEDGERFVKQCQSIQIQAVLMLQLDAGLRPSEFIDLNYGDVELKGDMILLHIREGKTGSRDVYCKRSVPYFLKWYSSHPTQKNNDPLWIMEFPEKSFTKAKNEYKIRRYDYYALKKRVEFICRKAKIEKPCDFYNLRHSSCTLDKKDNLPIDLSAKRHGHTTKYFDEVYGRLDTDDVLNRVRKFYGDVPVTSKIEKNKICERCKHINAPKEDFCYQCGSALSIKKAFDLQAENEFLKKEIKKIDKKMEILAKVFRESKFKVKVVKPVVLSEQEAELFQKK